MFLRGRETYPWRKEHFADLIRLSENSCEADLFTRMWRNGIIPLYHRYIRRHIKDLVGGADVSGIYRYSDTKIAIFSRSSGPCWQHFYQPLLFALYFVKGPLIRLGMIMAFTTTFTTTLAVFTKGGMFEIFAASTA